MSATSSSILMHTPGSGPVAAPLPDRARRSTHVTLLHGVAGGVGLVGFLLGLAFGLLFRLAAWLTWDGDPLLDPAWTAVALGRGLVPVAGVAGILWLLGHRWLAGRPVWLHGVLAALAWTPAWLGFLWLTSL